MSAEDDGDLQGLLEVVDEFCVAMKDKLAKKAAEGETGWDDPTQLINFEKEAIRRICNEQPVDAANFLCMIWYLTGRPKA